MDLATFALVGTAAVVHALWNLLAKQAKGGLLFVWTYSAGIACVYFPVAVWAFVSSDMNWTMLAAGAFVLTGVLHIGYSLALQEGYRRADLSVVYPVARGTGPALSAAGAVLLLGEPVHVALVVGVALVVAGVMIIGMGARPRDGSSIATGLRWGALTGFFIAGYTINDGAAVKLLGISPILLDYGGNLVRLSVLTPHAVRQWGKLWEELKVSWKLILALSVLMPIPYVLVLYAMTRAPVSVVAPARELSMMVGVLFGWWLLKEQDIGRRLWGAGLIAGGVALLFQG